MGQQDGSVGCPGLLEREWKLFFSPSFVEAQVISKRGVDGSIQQDAFQMQMDVRWFLPLC